MSKSQPKMGRENQERRRIHIHGRQKSDQNSGGHIEICIADLARALGGSLRQRWVCNIFLATVCWLSVRSLLDKFTPATSAKEAFVACLAHKLEASFEIDISITLVH